MNTTQHLVADIEALRVHLGIERWLVWVAHEASHMLSPTRRHIGVGDRMVLAAVTNGDRRDTDWMTRDMGRVFPRERERFVERPSRRCDLSAAYSRLLGDTTCEVRARAAGG